MLVVVPHEESTAETQCVVIAAEAMGEFGTVIGWVELDPIPVGGATEGNDETPDEK